MSSSPSFAGGKPTGVPSQYVAGFELIGELGRGGYTVTHRVLRHSSIYAMKILQRRGGEELPERAFRREAALLASVNHPGVVRVHEVGVADGLPYLVMDFVDGRPLRTLLADGRLPLEQSLRLGIDVASALGAAHLARLVHRDIKPDNILVGADGRARVIDFGLAVRPGTVDESATAGSLLYCAPEQTGVLRRPLDGRTDLYALGAVVYECVTGQPPFVSRDIGELLRMHATIAPPDPRTLAPDLPAAFAEIIVKLLAKDPDDRYQTADGLVEDLRRLAAGVGPTLPLGSADIGRTRADPPLIGRDAELDALLQRWELACLGKGSIVLIEGSAGSGKSRLARELIAAVQRGGALVLGGECEPDAGVPLAPLRRAFDAFLAAIAALPPREQVAELARVRAAAGPGASLLRGISPALDDVLAGSDLLGVDRHQQVLVAVASFIAALTTSAGAAVLYLDDVQWLDPSSRRVLQLLTDSIDTLPLLVMVTGRDDPVSATAMAQVRAAAGGRFDLALRLRSLPAEMVGDLISAATGGLRVDAAIAASLSARSGGNTFTLLQYLDALLDAGLLRPDWGHWRLDLADLPALVLSGSGVDLILRRLEGLDTDSRYVLRVAAVHGSFFDYRLIADACGLPHSRVLAVADTAAWRNLVERRDGHTYVFLHDRIREALAGEFTAAETRAVHHRLADMLTQSGRTDAASIFALARHCLLGEPDRDPARTYRACYTAGQMALAQHAPNEALELLDRANQAAGSAGIPFDPAFTLLLATAQQRAGRFADAIRTATLGHEQAVEPLVRARFLLLTAEALDTAWEQVKESRVVLQGLAEIGRPFPRKRGALLLSTAGMFMLARLGRGTRLFYGRARGANREKLRIEASLYSAGAWAYSRQMHVRQAMLCLLRATYPVMRIGPGREEARLQTGLATMSLALRNRRASRRHMKRAAALAARVGDPVLTGFVAWVEGFNRHNYGLDQGEALRRVLEVHGRWLEVGQQSDMLFILLWDALQRGSVKLAQQLADQRDGLSRIIGETGSEATARFEIGTAARAARAGLLAWQDRGDEAVTLLALGTVDGRLPRWEQLPIYGGAIAVAYERYDLGGYFDQAVDQFDGLRVPMNVLYPVALGWVLVRALGRIEQVRLARGDQRAARLVQAQDAVELIRRVARIPLLRARAEVARAALLQVSGQPKAALRHLARGEPAMIAVDAPVLAFETARTRAYALRDLRITGEAERQARAALAIACEQEWPHRIRLICREFDLDPGSVSPSELDRVASVATTNEAIALGRMRQRLAAIEQLGVAASRVVDPDKLATIALDETVHILGAERAFLFLMESPHAHAQLVPWGGRDHEGNDLDVLVEYSASTVERVRRSKAPVVFTGTDGRTVVEAHSVALHGLRSVMAAPIQLDGRLLGVVYLDSRVAKGIFTNDDVGVLTAITNHIAVALETARAAQLEVAVATANRQRDLAERLRAAMGDITGALGPEPESVLQRLARIAGDLVDGERVWLVLGTPAESTVLVYAGDQSAGDEGSIVELEPRLADLLSSDTTVYGYTSGSRPKLLDDDVRSWISVPLRARDETVGLLVLASSQGHAFDDGRGDIATSLAGHAMIAYENARLFSQVQQLATIDDLTGIANRRHFFELAERELARARRDDHGLIAMMVDIDHFKNINDEHGHQVGDEVIQIVAGRLARFARSYDLIGRYGGEEFALLMPDGPDPVAIAERLRSAVAGSPVLTMAGPLTVTVSVGAVSLSPADADLSALLGRADRRLYDAKRAGRNRVVAE